MARQSLIKKNLKQQKLFAKFANKRFRIKEQLKSGALSIDLVKKLQKLPKNSSKSRRRKRCFITGNARKINQFTGLSRHSLREYMKEGLLPGFSKGSW